MGNLTEILASQLLVPKEQFLKYAATAPIRYKKYQIAKRNGRGSRTIAQPAKELKEIQRFAVELIRSNLPIHESAFAYQPGKGIKKNATLHRRASYLLKMDFNNFFMSITPDLFLHVARDAGIEIDNEDATTLSNIFFWKLRRNSPLRLSIGAPSSPFISNAVMRQFDEEISSVCRNSGINYSRYADDLTFSTNTKNALFEIPRIVKKLIHEKSMGKITVNSSKTIFSSRKHNRHVTGITITTEGELSLGREKKRLLSSRIHKATLGLLPDSELRSLSGHLGFAHHVEPEFVIRMEKKYGSEALDKIRHINDS